MIGPDAAPARLEIMSFTGVPATPRTADPVGITRIVFAADDPAATRKTLLAAGAEDLGNGLLRGPVGVEIDLVPAGGTRGERRDRKADTDHHRRDRQRQQRAVHRDRGRAERRAGAPDREAVAHRRDAAHRQRRVLRRGHPSTARAGHRRRPAAPLRGRAAPVPREGEPRAGVAVGEPPGRAGRLARRAGLRVPPVHAEPGARPRGLLGAAHPTGASTTACRCSPPWNGCSTR